MALALLAVVFGGVADAADRHDIVTRGKQATALVDLGIEGSGSAFCVDTSGIFVTCAHVVESRSPGETVRLVLNSGQSNEVVGEARVVASDRESDVAILQWRDPPRLTALELADPKDLKETARVTVFGYPFGLLLAASGERYPSISVTGGSISALRQQAGELAAIQIDAAVNPGNSGGPLLNAKGDVIGIVAAANPVARIAIAVSSRWAKSLMSKPAILLNVPETSYAERTAEIDLIAEAVSLSGETAPDAIEWIIDSGARERTVTAKFDGSIATTRAALVDPKSTNTKLRLVSRAGGKTRSAEVDDRRIKVGGRELALSALRRIEGRAATPIVALNSGRKFTGELSNLADIRWDDGSALSFSAGDVIDVFSVEPVVESVPINYVVRRKDEQIAAGHEQVSLKDAPRLVPTQLYDPADPFAPTIDEFEVEIVVEGRDDILVGPAGLALRHHESKKPGRSDGKGPYVLVNGERWDLQWKETTADSTQPDLTETYPLKVGFGSWKMDVVEIQGPPGADKKRKRPVTKIKGENWGATIQLGDPAPGAATVKLRMSKKPVN
ncbi:Putative serine protease HhoB precursor [Caulifigura coniformis]|uniref:Serine protease HhoB n=1 Tax=Caulifigura coniformis TaxID=2527983 RepID=A0A517S857_9PLAN|nr:serine protease [Caulifigura coniformis]QDT52307.1 Putative serine protease HhoB precursor [Caulifigura coniformis]